MILFFIYQFIHFLFCYMAICSNTADIYCFFPSSSALSLAITLKDASWWYKLTARSSLVLCKSYLLSYDYNIRLSYYFDNFYINSLTDLFCVEN